MRIGNKISLMLATLFGVGYTPVAPGTAGCLPAILFFILIRNQTYFLTFTLIVVIVAFLVSSRAEELFGEKDSKKIVIDDFSGMLVTFLFIPQNVGPVFLISGFFLFRMLDMLKIPPANKLEQHKGALGIVGDDLAAGIYANLILQIVRLLLNIFS